VRYPAHPVVFLALIEFALNEKVEFPPHGNPVVQNCLCLSHEKNQEVTTDAQTFIQQAQSGNLIFIFDGLDEKLVHYTKDMRQQFAPSSSVSLADKMRQLKVFPMP
jgi:hypothetical protein